MWLSMFRNQASYAQLVLPLLAALTLSTMSGSLVGAALTQHTFQVGRWQCTNYLDVYAPFTLDGLVYNSDVPASYKQLFDAQVSKDYANVFRDPSNNLTVAPLPITVMACRSGPEFIFVDGGIGSFTGLGITSILYSDLQAAGFRFDAVTHVFCTHLHFDHTGIVSKFPNALVYISAAERHFWKNATLKDFSPPFSAQFESITIATVQQLLADLDPQRLMLFVPGESLPSLPAGITLVAMPGHTPAEYGVQIYSNGQSVLHVADALLTPASALWPEVPSTLDTLQPTSIATRHTVLDRLRAAEGTTIVATHFPWPGLARFTFGSDGQVLQYQRVLGVAAHVVRVPYGEQRYLPSD